MSGETKANMIHAVVANEKTVCPKCQSLNETGALYCASCGLDFKEMEKSVQAYLDKSVFAEGLPDWSIEPPQVVIRRKRI